MRTHLKEILITVMTVVLAVILARPVQMKIAHFLAQEELKKKEAELIGSVSGKNSRVAELQEKLKAIYFYEGQVDGILNKATRSAIGEFQEVIGLQPTGIMDEDTQAALTREYFADKAKSSAKKILIPGQGATSKIPNKQKAKIEDEIISHRIDERDRARKIQGALKNAGFYKGAIDGKIGPKTTQAIKEFQKSKMLRQDGVVNARTWEELKTFTTRR